MKMDSRDVKNEDKVEKLLVVKWKGGRKKKIVDVIEIDIKVEGIDDNDDGGLQIDNFIISIRRVGFELVNYGIMEWIVIIYFVDNVVVLEEMILRVIIDIVLEIVFKKKCGRLKSIYKIIQEKVKVSRLKLLSIRNDEFSKGEFKKKCEVLWSFEKVVVVKRGCLRKKVFENIEKILKKEEEFDFREQFVLRFDLDIESIDLNISGLLFRQKLKIRKIY